MSDNLLWCRFCGSSNTQHKNISVELLDKINYYLPINICLTNDSVSKKICDSCRNIVNSFHDFIEKVILMEKEYTTEYLNLKGSAKVDMLKTVSEKISKLPNLKIKRVPPKSANVKSDQPEKKYFKLSTAEYCHEEGNQSSIKIVKIEKIDEDLASDDSDNDDDPSSYEPSHSEVESKPLITIKKKISPAKLQKQSKVQVVHIQGPATYICMTCKDKFPTFEVLKEHIKSNVPCKSVNLTCEKCSKIFDSKKSLYQHSLTHREKWSYMCEECGKSYSNRFNLENHKSSFHGENVEEYGSIYKCKICDKQFTTRKDLYQHINTHSKEPQTYLCETCGKPFTSLDTLRSHIRVHLDIRNFNCDQCEKKFRSKLQLSQHQHVHTGIKPFVCESCKKTYAKKTSLIAHLRIHTLPYHCEICEDKFASISKLKTHEKCHVMNNE